ncbi:MAG: hypothetical protein L0323_01215 [Planctomycetes bacterium]|nr:hypothetical protein [Planctomycetota bacterium]
MRSHVVLLASLLGSLGAVGCRTSSSGQGGASGGDVFAVRDEERVRVALHDYADNFSATLQQAANAISDVAKDNTTRRRTITWKLRSVPAMRSIVAREDPRSALADAWAYTVQMHRFVREGEASTTFGEHQPIAVAACAALEEQFDRLASSLLGEEAFGRAREAIRQFAEEHPLRFGSAAEATLPSEEPKEGRLSWLLRTPISALNPFGGLDEGALAIRDFAKVASGFTQVVKDLPEVVSWRAELLLYELEEGGTARSVREGTATLAASAASLAEAARRVPEDVERVFSKALEDVETRSASLRETMREARGTIDAANASIAGAKELAVAVGEAARALERTGVAGERMAIALGLGPPPAGAPESPPSGEKGEDGGFDPKEFGDAADRLTRAAVEVQNIVREVKALAGSKEMEATVSGVNAISRSTVDHIAWRGLHLIGAALLAALLYRLLSSRLARGR